MLGWFAATKGYGTVARHEDPSHNGQLPSSPMSECPSKQFPMEMADLAQELNKCWTDCKLTFNDCPEFSSDLAHEIRTPISNLLTQTQVASPPGRDADTYQDILASERGEFERLARMVSDMFLAKTDRGVDLPNKGAVFRRRRKPRRYWSFTEAVAEERASHYACSVTETSWVTD